MRRLLAELLARDDGHLICESEPLPASLIRRNRLASLCFRGGFEEFRADFAASAAAALEREHQLAEALDALHGALVKTAPIKGASHIRTINDDPALRPMDDLDILVPREMFGRAVRSLESIGYTVAGKRHGLSSAHHVLTLSPPSPWAGCIDLHRSITQPYRSRIDLGDVWSRAIPFPEGSRPIDSILSTTRSFTWSTHRVTNSGCRALPTSMPRDFSVAWAKGAASA